MRNYLWSILSVIYTAAIVILQKACETAWHVTRSNDCPTFHMCDVMAQRRRILQYSKAWRRTIWSDVYISHEPAASIFKENNKLGKVSTTEHIWHSPWVQPTYVNTQGRYGISFPPSASQCFILKQTDCSNVQNPSYTLQVGFNFG
jgi:hypothetical protein